MKRDNGRTGTPHIAGRPVSDNDLALIRSMILPSGRLQAGGLIELAETFQCTRAALTAAIARLRMRGAVKDVCGIAARPPRASLEGAEGL